ncbi:probetacellulin-like [Erpetoichthys calabaricus]|uniref:probetacellulin-like n=1 Tax=Erpetoichthys calabaricus TaxID=27687 RepID=UPI00223447C5|nr:probetacellulin-like [Erpetoichthys calabaricus]XP_051784280.1 probetacellulin-like [Erpetoichthys calabaricus]
MAIFIMSRLTLVVITGLALCRYACANRNSTSKAELEELLCHQMNRNCSEIIGLAKRGGHFSKCPKEYKDYCIKGKCRYVIQEQQPACICEEGYIGSRCELMDFFYPKGRQKTDYNCKSYSSHGAVDIYYNIYLHMCTSSKILP